MPHHILYYLNSQKTFNLLDGCKPVGLLCLALNLICKVGKDIVYTQCYEIPFSGHMLLYTQDLLKD